VKSTAVAIGLVLSGLLMIGWAGWGVREYRRTGNLQWLWMAALLGMSFLVLLSQLAR
jgi:heme/copper-type cytochrome/quinol oxidase subunit 3